MEIVLAIICVIILVLGIRNCYELRNFEMTEYCVSSTKIKEEKEFLVLSDLHDNTYGKANSKLLKCINETGVDRVIIAGDMITGKKECDWQGTIYFLVELSKTHTIYYINGNHEYRTKKEPEYYGNKFVEYKRKLESAGVVFIENNHIDLGEIRITGLEIDAKYYKKIKKQSIRKEEIVELIGSVDENKYNVLVAHNPRYVKDYCKWNPDMVICGHFHGGMVRMPVLGGVISPQFDILPKYSGGKYRVDDVEVVVSKGLGVHSIKIRLFNKPEVIKIKLQKL